MKLGRTFTTEMSFGSYPEVKRVVSTGVVTQDVPEDTDVMQGELLHCLELISSENLFEWLLSALSRDSLPLMSCFSKVLSS